MVYTAFAAKENGSDVVQVRKYGEYRNIDYLIYVAGINQSFVMFYDAATYELQNMCSIGLRGLMLWQQLTLTLFLVLEMQIEIF